MKKYIYYHVYLTENPSDWSSIFIQQMKKIEDYGLMQFIDEIKIVAVGNVKQLPTLERLCETYDKTRIIHKPDELSIEIEDVTLNIMWEDAKNEDFNALFLHIKGVTSYTKYLPIYPEVFKNYLYWREFLEWGTIENWKECIGQLENFDCVSVNYSDWPSPHFSGNIWWARSKYIRKLPDPQKIEWYEDYKLKFSAYENPPFPLPYRLKDEMWILSDENFTALSLKNYHKRPPECILSDETIHRSYYI